MSDKYIQLFEWRHHRRPPLHIPEEENCIVQLLHSTSDETSVKEAHRLNLIRKWFGRVKLDPRGLAQLREKLVGLLKVKSLQCRTANAKLAEAGPKRWSQQEAERTVFTKNQVEELGAFWKGLWETKGQYNSTHPALLEWKQETRAQAKANPGDEDPIHREVAWGKVLKKQAGWRAPGPDCISAFWLRAFPDVVSLIKEQLWKLMDGASELPHCVVRGKTVMLPKRRGVRADRTNTDPSLASTPPCLNTTYKLLTTTLAETTYKILTI